MAVLEAFDLYRFYHAREAETLALRGVSLQVEAGEMVAIVGASGSGKSTLLHCLAGLDEPDGGYVTLMGKRLTRQPEAVRARLRSAHIGMLLQSGNLFESLSVEDNVRLQMQLARQVDLERIQQLIHQVDLWNRRQAYPSELSGGETARAGLAVALAVEPILLLADEPTAEVDRATEAQILTAFEALRSRGSAILIVTHSPVLAAQADRVIRLQDGRIINAEVEI